jgi:hypothetical protein
MSLVIFLQCFKDKKPAGMPRVAVRKAFAPFLKEPKTEFWRVQYDAKNTCTLFLEPFDADSVHQITVKRPCHDPRLWDALARLLRLPTAILYSPEGPGPVVLEDTVTLHIPRGILHTLGKPVVVRNGQEIQAAIQQRTKPPRRKTLPKQ